MSSNNNNGISASDLKALGLQGTRLGTPEKIDHSASASAERAGLASPLYRELVALAEEGQWGVAAGTKPLAALLDEAFNKESAIHSGVGGLRRCVDVVQVRVLSETGAVLREVEQLLSDGSIRKRNQLPAEKRLVGEDVFEAAVRCLKEELGLFSVPAWFRYTREEVETKESGSYPGLLSVYRIHTVELREVPYDLPQKGRFDRADSSPRVRKTTWGWFRE